MHHHDNPTGHMRPRQVRRILALMWLGAVLAAAAVLILAPKSHALNICGSAVIVGCPEYWPVLKAYAAQQKGTLA